MRPNFSKFPINPFVALELNASEYPQKYHWKTIIENDPIHAHIIESADLRRANPEYRNPRPGIMRRTIADAMRIYAWSPD
jgi:hypothetical protein